ncbi:MAG: hypothetical protein IJ934_06125 [Acetobacter sp.]|nr:hypothetical protein [Acetobacter sp.]
MVLPLVVGLLGAVGVGVAVVALVQNWEEIKNWLHDFSIKLKRVWKEICQKFGEYIPHEVKVFIDRVVEGVVHIAHRVYYQENDEWVQHTTIRKVPESEVPPDILAKHSNSKQKKNRGTDITDILRMELS